MKIFIWNWSLVAVQRTLSYRTMADFLLTLFSVAMATVLSILDYIYQKNNNNDPQICRSQITLSNSLKHQWKGVTSEEILYLKMQKWIFLFEKCHKFCTLFTKNAVCSCVGNYTATSCLRIQRVSLLVLRSTEQRVGVCVSTWFCEEVGVSLPLCNVRQDVWPK